MTAAGSGVACVAAVNGSLTPPTVRIMMDAGDVTRMFVSKKESRILEDPETPAGAGSLGGLGVYYGEHRMNYVTSMPETSWNDQMMTCVAEQDGFPDETVSAIVVVNCTFHCSAISGVFIGCFARLTSPQSSDLIHRS